MTNLTSLLTDYVRSQTPDGPPPALAGIDQPVREPTTPWLRWAVAAAAVLALVAGTAVLAPWADDSDQVPGLTVLATDGGSDRLPSTTATDWVTYADHVVVVTPVEQTEVPPAQSELDRGEGLIDRRVTLRVDDVLWSRPDADRPAPATFDWLAAGWMFDGTPADRGRVAREGEPRLEPGHSYLLAIEWEEARCSPGDAKIPAQWRGLGSFSAVPFDDGVVGQGEFEGRYRSASKAVAAADPDDPNYSFGQQMAGKSAADVQGALEQTKPATREVFTPPAPCDSRSHP